MNFSPMITSIVNKSCLSTGKVIYTVELKMILKFPGLILWDYYRMSTQWFIHYQKRTCLRQVLFW